MPQLNFLAQLPHQNSDDSFITKNQLTRKYTCTQAEIQVLEKLGYLTRVRLGPRFFRYWSPDVERGIKAFVNGEPPPPPTYVERVRIDWDGE